MQFSRIPVLSSNEVVRVLERLGCYQGKSGKSSHLSYHRIVNGRTFTGVVVLGRKEIPKGTLKNILTQLSISLDEFLEMVR